jgi:hypothetical protein
MGARAGADRARPGRSYARPDPAAPPATYRLELDDRGWTVRTCHQPFTGSHPAFAAGLTVIVTSSGSTRYGVSSLIHTPAV